MSRIILGVGCIGKSYLDRKYKNVYDFDKHTLDYKYDRTGFEHLTNEEFKGVPDRKIKSENWFNDYMKDFCKVIDSNEYDVVTGWLEINTVNFLVKKGYSVELVLVNCTEENESIYKERSIERGNSSFYWNRLKEYYNRTLNYWLTRKEEFSHIYIINDDKYLSILIEETGTILKEKDEG